jgi:WhiB family redox-sensing transcriptional regulator
MDGMSITAMKMAGDLAVTREQYRHPRPVVNAVSGERRNQAAATLGLFDFGDLFDVPEWQAEAACIDAPAGLFFSARGENAKVRQAKQICAVCPVADECLEYALANGEKFGTWGGKSERERRRIRRQRALDAA